MNSGTGLRRGLGALAYVLWLCVPEAFATDSPTPIEPRAHYRKPEKLEGRYQRRTNLVHVKFKDGLPIKVEADKLVDAGTGTLAPAQAVLASVKSGTWGPRFGATNDKLRQMRQHAKAVSNRDLPDLTVWFTLTLPEETDVSELVDALNDLDIVELVEPAAVPAPPPFPPSYQPNQGYLQIAATGIDAEYIWNVIGTRGLGIHIVNIEYNFNANHQDLPPVGNANNWLPPPHPPLADPAHGTAVMGQLAAMNNGWGITGIASDVSLHFAGVYHQLPNMSFGYDLANAILLTAVYPAISPGDIVLLEQQSFYDYINGTGPYVPCEWMPAVHAAIQYAVFSRQLVVVEAAGNADAAGGVNLDDPQFFGCNGPFYPLPMPYNSFDSGAIIVGAGAAAAGFGNTQAPRSRIKVPGFWGSNFGLRVNVQGWGEAVYTTGYGNLYNDPGFGIDLDYTHSFSGTSSASPIAAGAAALLQATSVHHTGQRLDPLEVRRLLSETATPQQRDKTPISENIGGLPDLRQVIQVRGWSGCQPAPGNDLCESPPQFMLQGSNYFENFCAANGRGGMAGCAREADVWYQYLHGFAGSLVEAYICGSSFDTQLAVYRGDCHALVELACDDDSSPCASTESRVVFRAEQNTTYYLRIGGKSGATGNGSLVINSLLQSAPCAPASEWKLPEPPCPYTHFKPSARVDAAMAYDEIRHQVVLFGGFDGELRNDTWLWDGEKWTLVELPIGAPRPSPRRGHCMSWAGPRTYTNPIQGVYLFGGRDNSTVFGDTWKWDGTSWSLAFPAGPGMPPPRYDAAMCSSSGTGLGLVLFGGRNAVGNLISSPRQIDWTAWGPQTWSPASFPNLPSPRAGHAMAATAGTVVVFGGETAGGLSNEARDIVFGSGPIVWPTMPPARKGHTMIYRPDRRRFTVFGGEGLTGRLNDVYELFFNFPGTWEWHLSAHDTPSVDMFKPRPMTDHAMAYDLLRGTHVVFGGDAGAQGDYRNETWELRANEPLAFRTNLCCSYSPTPGALAVLHFELEGGGPYQMNWYRNGNIPILDGPAPGGGTYSIESQYFLGEGAALSISNIGPADSGTYHVVIQSPCGEDNSYFTISSDTVTLTVACSGPPDGDLLWPTGADAKDIKPFIQLVMSSSTDNYYRCKADFDDSGVIDVGDIPGFVAALIGP